MSYRQELDEAIGDAPVCTIDVDRIIVRQRRARAVRVWGGGGAGAAAAVLAVTLAVGLLPGSTTPTVQPATEPEVATTAGTTADLVRLEGAVTTALRRAAPDITLLPTRQPGHQEPAGHFSTRREIEVAGARGTLIVQVARHVPAHSCRAPQPPEDGECWRATTPDAVQIRVTENLPADGRRQTYLFRTVSALRADGVLVIVYVSSAGVQGRLPLTVDQSRAVATDQAVTAGRWPADLELTPAPAPLPVAPTDEAQRKRLDRAALAAIRSRVPGVRARGPAGNTVDLAAQWRGDRQDNTVDSYRGEAQILVGDTPGLLSVWISRGESLLGCGTPGPAHRCAEEKGPKGERIVVATNTGRQGATVRAERNVTVLRKDGSSIAVRHTSDRPDGTFELAEQEQKAIALADALTLTPR